MIKEIVMMCPPLETPKRELIAKYRRIQPIEELERKAIKARRKGFFTVEDIDLAHAEGKRLYLVFNGKS